MGGNFNYFAEKYSSPQCIVGLAGLQNDGIKECDLYQNNGAAYLIFKPIDSQSYSLSYYGNNSISNTPYERWEASSISRFKLSQTSLQVGIVANHYKQLENVTIDQSTLGFLPVSYDDRNHVRIELGLNFK